MVTRQALQHRRELSVAIRPVDDFDNVRVMAITRAQGWFISWVTDILIYIVVLNLFAEFFEDHIHIGAFWISILTAVLFKVLLVILGEIEHSVHHRIEERQKWFVVGTLFLVVFLGKLAIIEIVNRVFDEVELHGLAYEAGMILTMIISSVVVWEIFERLGTDVEVPATLRGESKSTH